MASLKQSIKASKEQDFDSAFSAMETFFDLEYRCDHLIHTYPKPIIAWGSMVDLSLMAKLIEALPDHARLILLGDKDQLASVDTGSVMSDLCQGLVLGQTPRYSKVRCEQLNTLCFNGIVKFNA